MSTIIDNVVVLRKRRKSHCLLLSLWRLGWPNQQQVQDGKFRHGHWNQNVSTGMDFMDLRVQCLPCTYWLSSFRFCCTDIVWFLGFHLRRAPHNCTLHTPPWIHPRLNVTWQTRKYQTHHAMAHPHSPCGHLEIEWTGCHSLGLGT